MDYKSYALQILQDQRKTAAKKASQQEKKEPAQKKVETQPLPVTMPAAQIQKTVERVAADKAAGVTVPLAKTTFPVEKKAEIARKQYEEYKGTEEAKKAKGYGTSYAMKQQQEDSRKALERAAGSVFANYGAKASAPEKAPDSKERELKATADYYEAQKNTAEIQATTEQNLKELEGWSEEDRNNLERYITERAAKQNDIFSAPAFDKYNLNPIVEKYGDAKVRQMAETLEWSRSQQLAEDTRKAAENANPILGNIASVGTNIAGAVTAPIEYAKEMANRTGQYATLNPNNIGTVPSVYGSTVRQETSAKIKGDGTSMLRNLAAVGYQGGMSILDNAMRMVASGGSAGISAAIAASGTFGNSIQQYSAQGATPEQAATLAFADAGLEYLTEKMSDSQVLDFFKGKAKADTVKKFLWQTFGVEPLSDEVNFFLGIAAESAVLGDKASINQQIGELVAHGESYEKASREVWSRVTKEAAQIYGVSLISAAGQRAGAMVLGNMARPKPSKEQMIANAVAEATGGTPAQIDKPVQNAVVAKNATVENAAPQMQKNAADEATTINVRSATPVITDENSEKAAVAYELTRKLNTISDMDPVSNLTGREFQKSQDGKKLSDKVRDFFASIGNKVTRNGFGDVEFGEYGVGGILNHRPINRAKIVSIAAAPDVIKNGRQIGYSPNWKGRGYESFIFAAPVNVAGHTVYVAAVVDRRPNDKFYLSEMVDSDGNYVRIEESPSGNSKNELPMGPEVQQVRGYAGPEELSKGSDLTAKAVPMPPVNTIVQNTGATVNTKSENSNANNSVSNVDTSTQSTVQGQIQGTGAAEANFSGRAQYQEMLSDENSQPDRPTDVRPMEVLRTDPYERRVSDTAANIYGSQLTPDNMADTVQSLIQDGALGFDTRTNQESLRNAAEAISKKGAAATERAITKSVMDGNVNDGDVEKAMLLYAHYANGKSQMSQEKAAELMIDLATMANMTGRNLQLFKLLRRMTPEGQLYTVRKNVSRYIESINNGRSKQADVEIPQELETAFMTATSDEARQKAQSDIYKAVAAQIKPTLGEMWDAWRNLSMLGNVKTHIRNIAGSAAFQPYVRAKQAVGAAIESAALKQENRTKAALGVSKNDRALLNWAKADGNSQTVKDLMSYSGTTGDNARNAIEDARRILPGMLDTARKANMAAMEGADMFWKQNEYAMSMASFLKARGYTAEQVKNGQVPQGMLNEGRQIAVKEAMKATFNDQNKFSDTISKLRFKGKDPASKLLNVVAKGILPFTRTPANVLVRATEYNPAGIAKGLNTIFNKAKNGEATIAEGIDQLAAGLTGTGAMALGAALASGMFEGFKLVGKLEEEEKEAGAREYSLKVGDNYYGIEWLAPANMPLFIGANIYNSLKNKENADDNVDAWDIISEMAGATADVLDPMLELSMLSSLNEAIENMSYQDSAGDKILALLVNAATNYFTQGLPTIFGQLEQATETTKTSTYSNADNPLEKTFQRVVGNATQRIPGVDLYQKERVDAGGNVVKNEGDWIQRGLNAVISPVNKYTEATGPVWDEKARLNKVLTDKVSSPSIPKKISYTDTNGETHKDHLVTAEEYATMEKVQYQTENAIMEACVESPVYAAMSDKQKGKVFTLAQEYSREKARHEAINGYEKPSGWMADIDGKEMDTILRKVAQSAITDAIDGGNTQELEQAYDVYKTLPTAQKNDMMQNAGGRTEYFLKARSTGISAKTFLNLYDQYKDIDKNAGSATDKAQKWSYTLDESQKAGTITNKQKNVLRESMGFIQMFSAEATKYNDLVSEGVSTKNADWIAKAVRDLKPVNGKSSVTDWQEAKAIAESKMSEKEKAKAIKVYVSDAQDKNLDEVMAKGYSTKDYAKLLELYQSESGKGKKQRVISEFREAFPNMTPGEANALYKIFN